MDLTGRLMKALRDINNLVRQNEINLHDAEYLCNLRLVQANAGTSYRITAKGQEVLNNYRWPE